MNSRMPAVLAFDQAVTIPVVWVTAHCCFMQAQLQSMQEVLVHAASGGVGLVSVEWVLRARATAHATAGGIAKHALLRSYDVVHLSSSRNAAASAKLLSCLLRRRRWHSLVTALSNDFISLSLAMLAPQGVFAEIGKNSIWSHGRSLAARPFVDYVAIAVDDGCRNCPGWNLDPWWFNRELLQLSARVRAREVQPFLLEGFAFEERALQAALKLLQRGANLGKVVVRVGKREPTAEEHRAPSQEIQSVQLETQSLCSRGQERGTNLGTLVRLGIDAEGAVSVLELHDPQRFNTMVRLLDGCPLRTQSFSLRHPIPVLLAELGARRRYAPRCGGSAPTWRDPSPDAAGRWERLLRWRQPLRPEWPNVARCVFSALA